MFTKNRTILILGLLVALMPFLGFPYPYEEMLYVLAGLSVATLSYLLARHKRISRRVSHRKSRKEIVQSEPFFDQMSDNEDEQEPVQETPEPLLPDVTPVEDTSEIADEQSAEPNSYSAS